MPVIAPPQRTNLAQRAKSTGPAKRAIAKKAAPSKAKSTAKSAAKKITAPKKAAKKKTTAKKEDSDEEMSAAEEVVPAQKVGTKRGRNTGNASESETDSKKNSPIKKRKISAKTV